jgi:hypothetical protein
MSSGGETPRFTFPAEARDPRFRAFFDYWLSKAPDDGRRLPGRQHIDPIEMRRFLPYILLFDVVHEGGRYRFRYRLVGTHVVDLHGHSRVGDYVDDYADPAHYQNNFYPEMMWIIEHRQPHFTIRKTPVNRENFTAYHRLKLPLAADGETVDMVIGLYIGERPDGALIDAGRV